ncbi:hypothetical protein [Ktedonospora formicarum]|uniref:hypothetical protein n=1 Tax=Ktedonospora formicarum TaxID=2778364 RepID=UPI003B75BE46
MVESANKLVVQARLKGSGMHWQHDHVNPMLALRNAVCNERWQEMWRKALTQALKPAHIPMGPRCESQPQPQSLSFRVRDCSYLPDLSASALTCAAPQEFAPPASCSEAASPDVHLSSTRRTHHPVRSRVASLSQHLVKGPARVELL